MGVVQKASDLYTAKGCSLFAALMVLVPVTFALGEPWPLIWTVVAQALFLSNAHKVKKIEFIWGTISRELKPKTYWITFLVFLACLFVSAYIFTVQMMSFNSTDSIPTYE